MKTPISYYGGRQKLASAILKLIPTQEYAIRLQNVQIECKEAIRIISSRDSANYFFYCDSPYMTVVKTGKKKLECRAIGSKKMDVHVKRVKNGLEPVN